VLFCGKWPIKIRHLMGLRHPVTTHSSSSFICVACLLIHFPQKSPAISGSFAENDLQQKSPIISGSFAEIDLQLKASYQSSPPCNDSFKYLFHMCCMFLDSFFAKEPLIIGLFCGKSPVKKRHPMGLRHPVTTRLDASYICVAFFFINFSTTCTVIKSACFL